MKFEKYQGCGNDFIILDGMKEKITLSVRQIKFLCKRNYAFGADGLIIIEKTPEADFYMNFYNSDGSRASMCGNGARCAVKFALKNGYTGKKGIFLAGDGSHNSQIFSTGNVCISMNDVVNIKSFEDGIFLNTGVPHFVKFEKNINLIDVKTIGAKIANEERFAPSRTNVDFVEISEDKKYYIRTFERGVEDETLACGTGMVAAAIAMNYSRFKTIYNFDIIAKGGKTNVSFDYENETFVNIKLTGSAELIFEGEVDIL